MCKGAFVIDISTGKPIEWDSSLYQEEVFSLLQRENISEKSAAPVGIIWQPEVVRHVIIVNKKPRIRVKIE